MSWNAFLHERSTGNRRKEVKGQERRKRWQKKNKKRWRFGIYNLAWQNTVTSRHHINLCKYPHISPVCLPLPPCPWPPTPFPRLGASCRCSTTPPSTRGRWRRLLQARQTPPLCWLTEQAHVLQRQWNRNAQKRKKEQEAHSLVSRVPFFPNPSRAFFYPPCLALPRMKITPGDRLGCRFTSVSDIGSPLLGRISQVTEVVVMETGC